MTPKKSHRLRSKRESPEVVESPQCAYLKTSAEERHRCLEYVLECIARPSDSQSLKLAISEVAWRRKEFPPPSVATVCRWVHLHHLGAPVSNARPLSSDSKERALRFHMVYEE